MLSLHVLHPEEWLCDGVAYPKLPWLGRELLPKLARWATETRSSEFKSTLSLISVEKYSLCYQQLKDKYKDMVKVSGWRWMRSLDGSPAEHTRQEVTQPVPD